MVANPKYNTSIDEFSYGILMIHIMCGKWPEPQIGPVKVESGEHIPIPEAERRKCYLQELGQDHPLMDLILKCINNDPKRRAHASEIVLWMGEMINNTLKCILVEWKWYEGLKFLKVA